MNPKRQEAGRLGGIQTYLRYGRDYMVELGKLGGRPRTNNHRQLAVPEVQLNKKEEWLPNALKGLRELYAAKIKRGEAKRL